MAQEERRQRQNRKGVRRQNRKGRRYVPFVRSLIGDVAVIVPAPAPPMYATVARPARTVIARTR